MQFKIPEETSINQTLTKFNDKSKQEEATNFAKLFNIPQLRQKFNKIKSLINYDKVESVNEIV